MIHDNENRAKNMLRLAVLMKEISQHWENPEGFPIAAAPLTADDDAFAAKRLGISNAPDLLEKYTDQEIALLQGLVCKPSFLKSQVDGLVQKGHDRGTETGLTRLRTEMHYQAMREAGTSRVSAEAWSKSADNSGGPR